VKRAKKKHRGCAAAALQQGGSSQLADTRQFGRSRVSNAVARGSIVWLDNTDKRGPLPRRFKDIVALVTGDLGSEPSQLSECQRQIIRRIASLSVWCESQEAKMADGEEIDIDEFQRASNSLRRLCESIGLERRSRDVTPDLKSYIAQRYSRDDAEAAEEVA
jgi:hypothetical protein